MKKNFYTVPTLRVVTLNIENLLQALSNTDAFTGSDNGSSGNTEQYGPGIGVDDEDPD